MIKLWITHILLYPFLTERCRRVIPEGCFIWDLQKEEEEEKRQALKLFLHMHTIKEVSFSRRVLECRDRSLLNWFQTTENSVTWNQFWFLKLVEKKSLFVLLKCVKNLSKQACLQLFLRFGLAHWSCKKVACCLG